MQLLKNIHPGEILLEEFLKPLNISINQLSVELNISQKEIYEIINEEQNITPDIALKLSKYFGNSSRFWLGLQNDYNLKKNEKLISKQLEKIKTFEGLKVLLNLGMKI